MYFRYLHTLYIQKQLVSCDCLKPGSWRQYMSLRLHTQWYLISACLDLLRLSTTAPPLLSLESMGFLYRIPLNLTLLQKSFVLSICWLSRARMFSTTQRGWIEGRLSHLGIHLKVVKTFHAIKYTKSASAVNWMVIWVLLSIYYLTSRLYMYPYISHFVNSTEVSVDVLKIEAYIKNHIRLW